MEKDLLSEIIYPAFFERAAELMPEFGFTAINGGAAWVGRSGHKVDGSHGNAGKVYYYANNPGNIIDYTRGSISLWDYISNRDGIEGRGETFRRLCELAGVQAPVLNPETEQRNHAARIEGKIWELANNYFTGQLHRCKDAAAGAVRTYIERRGYTLADMRFDGAESPNPAGMELGYFDGDTAALRAYIVQASGGELTDGEINAAIKLPAGVGTTHRLIIPYRVQGGAIRGIVARAIDSEVTPKYLYSKGLERSNTLFNLSKPRGSKNIVIVEGLLDALIATARGVENVIALGGASLNATQAALIARYKPAGVILCLDADKAGSEATGRAIDTLRAQSLAVYVATLSGGKDPDEVIRTRGVDALKTSLAAPLTDWEYLLQNILSHYGDMQAAAGALTALQIDALAADIVRLGASITEPIAAARYTATVTGFKPLTDIGITPAALNDTVERVKLAAGKERQAAEFSRLLRQVETTAKQQGVNDALALLSERAGDLRAMDSAAAFGGLMRAPLEADIAARLKAAPDSLRTGYEIGGEELLLPAGAISIIAAPTSHGKTTFLINLINRIVERYPDKCFYYLSYEEDADSILISALNTYVNKPVSANNRRSIRAALSGDTRYLGSDSAAAFSEGKARFFTELVSTGRLSIHYVNYHSDELINAIHYLHRHGNAGGIFIDYLQLLTLPAGRYKTYSRQEELKQICISLKDTAVSTGLPLILGAQFNRTVVNPLKLHATNIGEAGDIERVANLMLGFWNNAFDAIGTDGEKNEMEAGGMLTPGTIYTTILKHRGGRANRAESLPWNGNTGTIGDPVAAAGAFSS